VVVVVVELEVIQQDRVVLVAEQLVELQELQARQQQLLIPAVVAAEVVAEPQQEQVVQLVVQEL
tara:strand:- start:75 stop:266 length:192 start_codon:yes stop_codon:yes gene_type:complete